MWLKTSTEYTKTAMKFAREKVSEHYDRMGYGDSSIGIQRRQSNIYIGKIAEYTICKYLQEELGLDIIRGEGNGPDQFDFKIRLGNDQSTGDIKSFHIWTYFQRRRRTQEYVEENSWALVPVDQYRQRPKDLYIFAVLLGDEDMPRSLNKTGSCFVKWATQEDISEWHFIKEESQVFIYPKTKTDNYGEKMSECRRMEDFIAGLIN